MRARAFWVEEPGRGSIRTTELTAPLAEQVLVRTSFSAVSRGTESLVFTGRVPHSEFERMRCPHQEGEFPAAVKYGYSNVGHVLEGRPELRGKDVFCLFPHQTAYVVAASQVIPLPDGVSPARAVLAANVETALNALWDARPLPGDRVSVIGAGVVGSLVAYLCGRIPGTEVTLIDLRPERVELARALGVTFATPQAARGERDLVFHASGNPAGLRTALALASRDASVIELSWFGDREVTLPLGEAFHARRLSLRSSQVGTVSPHARARYDHRARLELALALCADPALDALFTGESDFDELPTLMPKLASGALDALCHRLRYAA
jgi:2-desacetyl-2-hydroxyethyl bacteriochlorophyllide A dehydrogenase